MVRRIKLLKKESVTSKMMQPLLDAAALHRALLVLSSFNPSMQKLLPPRAPSGKVNHGVQDWREALW